MAENTWASLLGEDHARTCKWLGSPPFISQQKSHLEGEQQHYLVDLLTMIINHLLSGMILQVGWKKITPRKKWSEMVVNPTYNWVLGPMFCRVTFFFGQGSFTNWHAETHEILGWFFNFRDADTGGHEIISGFLTGPLGNQTCLEKLRIHQWKVY